MTRAKKIVHIGEYLKDQAELYEVSDPRRADGLRLALWEILKAIAKAKKAKDLWEEVEWEASA
jgi:hypothetical protein